MCLCSLSYITFLVEQEQPTVDVIFLYSINFLTLKNHHLYSQFIYVTKKINLYTSRCFLLLCLGFLGTDEVSEGGKMFAF